MKEKKREKKKLKREEQHKKLWANEEEIKNDGKTNISTWNIIKFEIKLSIYQII